MRKNIKQNRFILSLLALTLVVGSLLWVVLPGRKSVQQQSICRVTCRACYAIPLDKSDTLYLPLHAGNKLSAALCADSLKDSVDISGVFVSRAGHVLTSDSLVLNCPDSLTSKALLSRLAQLDTLLATECNDLRSELKELDYYARTHSAIDDGYNEVMTYREMIKTRSSQSDSAHILVKQALSLSHPVALLHTAFNVRTANCAQNNVAQLKVRGDGMLLLQLASARLPQGASRFAVYRWGTYTRGARLFAYNDFGEATATDSVVVLGTSDQHLPATEGAAWVNASGHLCGIERQEQRTSSYALAKLFYKEHCLPVWWLLNAKNLISQLFTTHPIEAHAKQTVATPHYSLGTINYPDSSCYKGQYISKGKPSNCLREGYGQLTLPNGTIYKGVWRADTLVSGQRVDSMGTYKGDFNAKMQADGSGTLTTKSGETYHGQWSKGKRNGHGFSSGANRMVRCGEWKNDRFRGERMVYTTDRVYGIDISRYQHGKGRKYYPIYWDKLRITSLGYGRRVQGSVDYPVSYVYIKATEGKSLYNKYYATDIRQARAHAIPVGSYHFFSPKSSGAQQATYFLKMAWIAKGDLPPVLDLEPTDKQVAQMGGDVAMFRQVLTWLHTVEKARGKRPVLYVGQQFVNNHMKNAPAELRDYDVWIARYGEFKPYIRLLYWQLTPYGRVRGITGEVDINIFNGTREQFVEYLKSH